MQEKSPVFHLVPEKKLWVRRGPHLTRTERKAWNDQWKAAKAKKKAANREKRAKRRARRRAAAEMQAELESRRVYVHDNVGYFEPAVNYFTKYLESGDPAHYYQLDEHLKELFPPHERPREPVAPFAPIAPPNPVATSSL